MDWQLTGVLAGGVCVLAIYSFLYKENPFYRLFEHLFIGVATGFGVVLVIFYFYWPDYIKPKFGFDLQPWESYNWANVLWVLPALYGLLIYFILSRKRAWLARLVIGLGLGMGGGLFFKGFFSQFLPDVVDSFRPLVAYQPGPAGAVLDWRTMGENLFFMVTLVSVMTYFFFSFEHDKPAVEPTSTPGRAALAGVRAVPSVVMGIMGAWLMYVLLAWKWPGCAMPVQSVLMLMTAAACLVGGLFLYQNKPLLQQTALSGRWLMMITFGAFFGATVMARMALLIDRLQFLTGDWWTAVVRLFGGG